jgi:hypothetical protein
MTKKVPPTEQAIKKLSKEFSYGLSYEGGDKSAADLVKLIRMVIKQEAGK